ncbi:hypothetical protein JOQ06_020280 [Pogonophryne albipinna]|uniref:Zinc finger BED domain-containing 1-like protein n=1 Tax=Pogonophryne albipinna TaxID=1090488 RepID=A0AAD6BRW4_9TELE|nr:hypothetical protein JOQ06_020280 [Pogonophryne albipinna]
MVSINTLKSHCLQTVYFPAADHTGENIAHGLRESLSNWGLKEEDQTCITTDNGSNVVKAVELNHWTRLQCFGHRLHLAIDNALKEKTMKDRINRATGLYRKTRHLVPSWQDIEVLESINNALCPLQEFTDALSGEAYVSVSYLKTVLHLLKTSTLAAKDEDTALTKEIKSLVLGYMENKYSDPATQELLDIT